MSVSLEAIELVESAFDMDLLLADGIAFAYEPTLLEAFFQKKKWDKTKHPRWPAGTPNAPDGSQRAGKFMLVGQRFTLKGKDYEVAHVVGGVVYAHVATGKYGDTKTVALKPTTAADGGLDIVGVTPAAPTVIKGGSYGVGSNVTVIDPYVDHASHDPSLPKPEKFSAAEWARFGKLDQEHYLDLMERFGDFDPKTTQSIHHKVYGEYEQAVQSLVQSAYSTQFGHSYQSHLALWQAFGGGGAAAGQAKREKAKELQSELGNVLQWDLYNRTRSPDIFAVHKTPDVPMKWSKMIDGDTPLFAGLSQTFHWRPEPFGSNGVFTPLAIRHITLATIASQPIPGQSHFADTKHGISEREISVPEQLAIDHRSRAVANSGMTPALKKWLEQTTSEPRGGEFIEQFYDLLDNGGSPPVTPASFSIQMTGAGAKQWADPPPEAAAMTKGWKVPGEQSQEIDAVALGKMDLDIDFKFVEEDGTPKLMTALDSGFQAGDFMLGKKGTLFWVGTDPGDPTGYGLIYHKIVDGKFVGEQYNFTSTESKRYRLVQTFAEPPPPLVEGAPGWEPQAWAQTLEKEFVGKLKKGDKFKHEGHGYELLADGNMNQTSVSVLVLESGLTGAVNTDYKTPLLVPKEDYVPPESPDPATMTAGQQFKLPGKLLTATGEGGLPTPTAWIVSLGAEQGGTKTYSSPTLAKAAFDAGQHSGVLVAKPQVGDMFPWDGTRHTITSILKDGTIRAKAQGETNVKTFLGGFPGSPLEKVMAGGFFRPGDWVHNPGQKVKLSSLQVGELFDTGAGAKLQPAVVTGKDGAKVTWKSLMTGAEESSMGHKAVRQIVAKGEVSLESEGMPPVPDVAASEGKFDASKYKEGPFALWKDIPDGALFSMTGKPFKKLNANTVLDLTTDKPLDSGWHDGSAPPDHAIHTLPMPLLVAKDLATGPFEHDKLTKGDQVQLINLQAGDQFTTPTGYDTGVVYEVLTPSDGESMAKVAKVLPGGGYGPVASMANPMAKFVQSKGDTTPVTAPTPIDIDDDVEGLQNAVEVGLTPYASKWGSGGKYVHYQIKEMAVGAHFRDTSGGVWIVKHAGPVSVISDGSSNYKVDGSLRGRVLDTKTKIDSAPPLGTEPAKKDAWAGLKATDAGSVIGDFDFKAGDKFAHEGVVYEVNYTGPAQALGAKGHVHASAVPEGYALGFMAHDAITHVSADTSVVPWTEPSLAVGSSQKGVAGLPIGTTVNIASAGASYTKQTSGEWKVDGGHTSFGDGVFGTLTATIIALPNAPAPSELLDVQVGSVVTLKPGTLYQQGISDSFKVVGEDGGKWLLDNNVGGEVSVSGSEITSVQAAPTMPKVGDIVAAGYVNDTNPDHPDGPKVEIVGHDLGEPVWMNVADAHATPFKVGQVVYTKHGHPVTVTGFQSPYVEGFALDGGGNKTDGAWTQAELSAEPSAGVPAPDASLDDYLGADFWPDAEPLPQVGDSVWYLDAALGHSKGVVGDVLPSGEYGINPDDGGFTVWVPEHDLLRPGTVEKGPLPPDPLQVYSDSEPMFGAEGQPILKGQKYALKFGIGSPEYGTALGSGNAPGTVMVQFGDGGKSEFAPSYFFPDDSAEVPAPPAVSQPSEGGLQPYKSPYGPGGKYKHEPIGTLAPGTVFKDKSKGKFTVVAHDGAATIYEDAAGKQFSTKGTNRVRKLADAFPAPVAPKDEFVPVIEQVQAEKQGLSPTVMTYGDLKTGDKFAQQSGKVWTVTGVGTVSGWAKSGGEVKNFMLSAPVVWHLPAPKPLEVTDSADLQPGDIFVIGSSKSAADTNAHFMLLSHATASKAAQIEMIKTTSAYVSQRGKVMSWSEPGSTPKVKVQVLGKKAFKPPVSDAPIVPLPEQESAALPVASINSYGSAYGPGGKYKHPHIDALKSSDVFRDKDGAKFVFSHVVSTATENHAVVMRQSDNEFVKLPVWVTNAKGKLVKSRVRVVE